MLSVCVVTAAGFLLGVNPEVFASRLPFASGYRPHSDSMTNEDVLRLRAAGMGDKLIAGKIASGPCAFRLSTADLVTLKNAGVSDDLISAMMRARNP